MLARVLCWLLRHRVRPTGRRGVLLREWRCQRCGRLLMENPVEGGMLVLREKDLPRWNEMVG